MTINLYIVLRLMLLFVNVSLLYCMLTRKKNWMVDVASFAGTWLVTVILVKTFRTFVSFDILTSLFGTLYLIPTIVIFKEHWKVKVFTFFMIYSITHYITLLITFIYNYEMYFREILPLEPFYFLIAGFEVAVLFFIYQSFSKTVKPVLEIIAADKRGAIFSLLPISLCVIFFIMRIHRVFDLYMLSLIILITCIILTALYLMNLAIRLMNRKNHLESQLMLQLDHYKALTEGIQQARIYHHDFRHHLAGVAELLGKQEIAATREYLDHLNVQYAESYVPIFCADKYIDAVIAHYSKIAQQVPIALETELSLPEENGIEPLDLCVIIGNCFENAIEACRAVRADERRISIRGKIAHGYMAITFKNSCVNEIKRQKDRFLSSKQPNRLGIGLESVRLLAQKYDGDVRISTEQGSFIAAISLKIPTADPALE